MRVATHSNDQDLDPSDDRGGAPPSDDSSNIDIARAAAIARAWVHDHPLAALGVAVAAGFVVGRLVRR